MDKQEVVDAILNNARLEIKLMTRMDVEVYCRLVEDTPSYESKVADFIGIILEKVECPKEWILEPSRGDRRPVIRQLISYMVLRRYPRAKLGVIAKEIGVTHHSSVIHANHTAKDLLETKDELFLSFYNKVKYLIDEKV